MIPACLQFRGETLLADPSGALMWPALECLIVADLHFEKGSAFARAGLPLPPYDTRETLRRLTMAVRRYAPRRVICLGDSFHDGHAADRLGGEDEGLLARLVADRDWIWISGNHDPAPPAKLGGSVATEVCIPPFAFRHEALTGPAAGEVSGHFHPRASVRTRGHTVAGRCFIADEERMILPAFGAYAGGLDVRDPAIRSLFAPDYAVHLLGHRRVHSFPCYGRNGATSPRP